MKILAILIVLFAMTNVANAGKAKSADCPVKNVTQLKEHLKDHVTFPTTGKVLKETCKKEWPDEFTKAENDCMNSKIKDEAKFEKSEEVLALLGVK